MADSPSVDVDDEQSQFIQAKSVPTPKKTKNLNDKQQKQTNCLWITLISSMVVMGLIILYLSYTIHNLTQQINNMDSSSPVIAGDSTKACLAEGKDCSHTCCKGLDCTNDICCTIAGDQCDASTVCCGNFVCFGGTCSIPGRPYNLLSGSDSSYNLHSNINYTNNTACNYDLLNTNVNIRKYISSLLSEHASIGTFNKFSVELMNLGGPLWLIELAQNAALDEINHTRIMKNIVNSLLIEDDDDDDTSTATCIEIGKFPDHNIEINSNCNHVSLDVVNGGCFGETVSSISTIKESVNYNQLYSVSSDEIKHSTLAWISAKWMINNCDDIDVSKDEWWQIKLQNIDKLHVIHKVFDIFWRFEGQDYKRLYNIIHDTLNQEIISVSEH